MAAKKPEKDKRKSTKRIAASISKPVLPTSTKLDRALGFAETPLPLQVLVDEQMTPALSVSPQESVADMMVAGHIQSKISAWSLMPQSDEAQQIMRARAKIFSQQAQQQTREASEQYIRFRLGKAALYGVPYASMKEILPATKVSRVPCTPLFIAGIVNYRGELLTVLDLRKVFHIQHDEQQEKCWIIVVREGKLKVGLIADGIDDNDEFAPAHLAPSLDDNELIRGIHQGKVVILNISAIFTNPALIINESVG
ncbi:purine-binding chemotaxis protein CheW [Nitrosomonas sp. Nm84]|uniref:chemotaxis protein CheW n=1 Tax=Nitrosomonas sp. Nm84 TaxID=200124 RepID=UPI000D76F323|nr:chemotaxis protein CheW [Nitrosomonas sp. Nm84]PXW86436.1 purine-binding chemotaxis protein CheW [Nitrosomonas sp. Nm84]